MKRFSVLLVVVVFLIPLVVYGLSGNFDRGPIDRGIEPDIANISALSGKEQAESTTAKASVSQPLANNPQDQPDITSPPLFPDPEGIKGTIDAIDTTKNIIFLKDAEFFNPLKDEVDIADFTIHVQAETMYLHDTQQMVDWGHLEVGMEIICQGLANYERKIVTFSNFIFSGNYYEYGETIYLTINGPIISIDKERNSLTFLAGSLMPFSIEESMVEIFIQPDTKIYKVLPDSKNTLQLDEGVIPTFASMGTMVNGVVKISYGQDDFNALDLGFFDGK